MSRPQSTANSSHQTAPTAPALPASATTAIGTAGTEVTPIPAGQEEEWSEEKLKESLRRLDDLHNRLIGLRTVIPKILHPLAAEYPTPVEMFDDFSVRALSCSEEIEAFNSLYVKSQHIFAHAAWSRARDPEDIRRLTVGELFLPEEQARENDEIEKQDTEMKDAPVPGEDEEEEVENTKDEDIEDVVEEFSGRLMHRDVTVEELPGGTSARRSLRVVLPPPSSLLFTIEITPSSDNSRAFVVTSVKSAKKTDAPVHNLHTGIMRAVTARQWPGNLEMLLEMLGAYRNIFSAKCDKCKRLTAGSKVELPVVRKLAKDALGKRWIAIHEGCNGM